MGEVMTQIMKGNVEDELPFFVGSLSLELCPQMLNAPLGEMIGTSVLPQPGSPLTGKDIRALRVSLKFLWCCWIKVVAEGSPGHVVQIKRPRLSPFGIHQGNAACSLIDGTLIQTQLGDFADAQPCPV